MQPEAEKTLVGVKLIFTTGTPEKFQANGAGTTYEEALGMAMQTMLDFKCFQIEQLRLREGGSPLMQVNPREGQKTWAAGKAKRSDVSAREF